MSEWIKVCNKLSWFTGWQHPYVNIFKHVKVEDWRRSAREGDVSTYKVSPHTT